MVDPNIPNWLAARVDYAQGRNNSSISQDIALGAQLAQNRQQMDLRRTAEARLQRAAQLEEEAKQLILDEKERVAVGMTEVTKVLAEMGDSGGYSDPNLQAKFWETVSMNPKVAATPAFKEILDIFQYAEQAKSRSELLKDRYNFQDQNAYGRHLDRLAEIRERGVVKAEEMADKSDYDLLLLDEKNQHRQEQIRLQSDENIRRDTEKQKSGNWGPARFDLPETARRTMSEDFEHLSAWYETNMKNVFGNTPASVAKRQGIEAEYEARRQKIIEHYDKLRRKDTLPSAPAPAEGAAPASSAPSEKVLKYNPTTKTFE